jgi:hypothetical protein
MASSHRTRGPASSLHPRAQLGQAARDPARDRARRQVELLADRAVALVPGEEAVEDLPAVLGQLGQELAHHPGLLEPLDRLVRLAAVDLLHRLDAARVAQAVEAAAPRQLRDPRPHGVVLAELAEPLVDPREHLLEDVVGVVLGQPEALDADREHVAGEPLDELVPGLRVALAAARDQLGVRRSPGLRPRRHRS